TPRRYSVTCKIVVAGAKGDRRAFPEALCSRSGSDQSQISVANGNQTIPGRSHRIGVTNDETENAPRPIVPCAEDSKKSKPPRNRAGSREAWRPPRPLR